MEKRKSSRLICHINAEIVHKKQHYKVEIKDIGLGGMFFYSDDHFEIGEKLDVVINLPGNTFSLLQELKGKVIRFVNRGTAIEFENYDYDSFSYLKNAVYLYNQNRQL